MNTKKYKWLFYFITFTILTTIAVQFFWNYKNYQENKQRVANEIQLSLDNAIEEYFTSEAKNDFLTIIESKPKNIDSKVKVTINDLKISTDENMSKEKKDSLLNAMKNFVTRFHLKQDTLSKHKETNFTKIFTQLKDNNNGYTYHSDGTKRDIKYFKGKKAADSLKLIKKLEPVFISFFDEVIEYKKIDSLLEKQLTQKGINIKNSFIHFKKDSVLYESDTAIFRKPILAISKSTFVKDNEAFKLKYTNPNTIALKRSFGGILLSLLLSLLIISCLFYLLKVINNQKELAEIKNDLISNITHEFKTPITTVSTALEAISNFNAIDDKEKTKKYLSISSVQLKKLHQMVEKLLETATLDSEKLMLKKEPINVVDLIDKLSQKHQLITSEKSISFSSNLPKIFLEVDVFHFENAISNLIDNAVKYGGNTIEINVNSVLNNLEISVADNGKGIEKNLQEKVFDKFYRVPKGNTHDVKGFGIGLYYTKKIIEKHNGKISLNSNLKNTVFKITLPNGQ